MQVLDYRNSFVLNTAAVDGEELNTCRTQILARCTVRNESTKQAGDFFLGKECIGEAMYRDGGIAQLPTSEVCIVFSEGISALHKKFADHGNDVVQVGDATAKRRGHDGRLAYWTDLSFKLNAVESRRLKTSPEIIRATLDAEPMVGRTTVQTDGSGWKAVLEYPIAYMNVHPPADRFQVDVGPVLLPDFDRDADSVVSRLDFAYVMYNELDRAEFAVRTPTDVGENAAATTLHYSKVTQVEAKNEVFSLAG